MQQDTDYDKKTDTVVANDKSFVCPSTTTKPIIRAEIFNARLTNVASATYLLHNRTTIELYCR